MTYFFLNLIQFIPAGYEVILILVIIGILFFGYKKIPALAKSFGRATSEFQKAKLEAKRELDRFKSIGVDNSNSTNDIDREKLETIAGTLGIDYTNKDDEELRTAIEAKINNK
ncbi:MAG: Sec-independent protein translocase subunit TatA/TatB [Nitrososphaeraceae archaeon]